MELNLSHSKRTPEGFLSVFQVSGVKSDDSKVDRVRLEKVRDEALQSIKSDVKRLIGIAQGRIFEDLPGGKERYVKGKESAVKALEEAFRDTLEQFHKQEEAVLGVSSRARMKKERQDIEFCLEAIMEDTIGDEIQAENIDKKIDDYIEVSFQYGLSVLDNRSEAKRILEGSECEVHFQLGETVGHRIARVGRQTNPNVTNFSSWSEMLDAKIADWKRRVMLVMGGVAEEFLAIPKKYFNGDLSANKHAVSVGRFQRGVGRIRESWHNDIKKRPAHEVALFELNPRVKSYQSGQQPVIVETNQRVNGKINKILGTGGIRVEDFDEVNNIMLEEFEKLSPEQVLDKALSSAAGIPEENHECGGYAYETFKSFNPQAAEKLMRGYIEALVRDYFPGFERRGNVLYKEIMSDSGQPSGRYRVINLVPQDKNFNIGEIKGIFWETTERDKQLFSNVYAVAVDLKRPELKRMVSIAVKVYEYEGRKIKEN